MSEGKLRIAIPEPTSRDLAYNRRCWQQYAEAVEQRGACAVEISLHAAPATVAAITASCSGVLLPGSPADIHPQKYGEEAGPETAPPDPLREAVDELLLQDAFNLHKPVFGVCYGLQSINVWRGGTLSQHLPGDHSKDGSVRVAHRVRVTSEAYAGAGVWSAPEFAVNSSHHQGVARVGDGLIAAAVAIEDGTIEAVQGFGVEGFVLGVQWHPERTAEDAQSGRLFDVFVAAARDWENLQSHILRSTNG